MCNTLATYKLILPSFVNPNGHLLAEVELARDLSRSEVLDRLGRGKGSVLSDIERAENVLDGLSIDETVRWETAARFQVGTNAGDARSRYLITRTS